MSVVEDFFRAIDKEWKPTAPKTRLSIIGSGALMLQAAYERGTKDSDVFETTDLARETQDQLFRVAGRTSALARRHGLYAEVVPRGIPFLAQVPMWRPIDVELVHLELRALDVVDVVVAKLMRFNAIDQQDIDAMVQRDLVPAAQLVGRFRAAMDFLLGDAREADLPEIIANLHRVERDMLGVDETDIELPSWIDR